MSVKSFLLRYQHIPNQLIKKRLPKSFKSLLFDLSWDAAKTFIFAHIPTFIPVVAVILIGQKLYSCLEQPFHCITHNYSEMLLVIGLVLMLLSILINRKESENKFAELKKNSLRKMTFHLKNSQKQQKNRS